MWRRFPFFSVKPIAFFSVSTRLPFSASSRLPFPTLEESRPRHTYQSVSRLLTFSASSRLPFSLSSRLTFPTSSRLPFSVPSWFTFFSEKTNYLFLRWRGLPLAPTQLLASAPTAGPPIGQPAVQEPVRSTRQVSYNAGERVDGSGTYDLTSTKKTCNSGRVLWYDQILIGLDEKQKQNVQTWLDVAQISAKFVGY